MEPCDGSPKHDLAGDHHRLKLCLREELEKMQASLLKEIRPLLLPQQADSHLASSPKNSQEEKAAGMPEDDHRKKVKVSQNVNRMVQAVKKSHTLNSLTQKQSSPVETLDVPVPISPVPQLRSAWGAAAGELEDMDESDPSFVVGGGGPSKPTDKDEVQRMENIVPADEETRPDVADAIKKAAAKGKLMDFGNDTDLDEELYDVMNFYHTEGWAQFIARSAAFNNITLAVIMLNALYIGVESDRNPSDILLESHLFFQTADHLFCLYFTGEVLIRFAAFKHKLDCLKDHWFKFDACLIVLMVAETWIMTIVFASLGGGFKLPTGPLKLLRMLRLARLVRLLRTFPELMTLVKGMMVACRAVMSSLVLVVILVYVFGIVLHMFLKDKEEVAGLFETLPKCMWTLTLSGVFLDNLQDALDSLMVSGAYFSVIVFFLFILLASITVMNMLIGILCEVVSAVKSEQEESLAVDLMKSTVLIMLKHLDADSGGDISREEMQTVLEDKDALKVLSTLAVNPYHLTDLMEMYFQEGDSTLTIEFVMELILSCRGSRQLTMRDMLDGQTFVRWELKKRVDALEGKIEFMISNFSRQVLTSLNSASANGSATNPTAFSQSSLVTERGAKAL